MTTRVVNIKKGHEFDAYIGRPGHGYSGYFGNPFSDGSREENLKRYRQYFLDRIDRDIAFKSQVQQLKGKRLGCFCYPEACHGDTIVEWLEQENHQ